jgi:ABC-type transporter lipoprotein component MlaA
LQKNAIDLYAEIRSLYRQHRAAELRHGEAAPTSNEMDELYRDPGAPSAAPPAQSAPAPH